MTSADLILETDFIKEMARQMRALDSYGQYDGQPVATLLEPFVLTQERKAGIPLVGDPDETVLARVKAFYNAIAVLIEKECGLMAVPLIHLTHEGFGRGLITVGKLVVLDRTLRDVHDVRVRETDDGEIVNFHCRVDSNLSVQAVHEKVDALERALKLRSPSIKRVIGHAEPTR